MHCTECGVFLLPGWNACNTCRVPVSAEALAAAAGNSFPRRVGLPSPEARAVREALLEFRIADRTSSGLSEWLEALQAETRGTVGDKSQRIREHTGFLDAPAPDMLAELVDDLLTTSSESLGALCEACGLAPASTKHRRIRQLHRFVATNEGLLPEQASAGRYPTPQEVFAFVDWYPHYQSKTNERELYGDFADAMMDVFGEELVHEQVPVAHGVSLKIDFHIGSVVPGEQGIGIEFKVPGNNSDIQKAMGQLDQYHRRYGQSLLLVVFDDFVQQKHLQPFLHDLRSKGIGHVVKRVFGTSSEDY